jgi:hypothetical protein
VGAGLVDVSSSEHHEGSLNRWDDTGGLPSSERVELLRRCDDDDPDASLELMTGS